MYAFFFWLVCERTYKIVFVADNIFVAQILQKSYFLIHICFAVETSKHETVIKQKKKKKMAWKKRAALTHWTVGFLSTQEPFQKKVKENVRKRGEKKEETKGGK